MSHRAPTHGWAGRGSDVLIAMWDNRPLVADEYWALAARLNHFYACHHGYDFRYFMQLEDAVAAEESKPKWYRGPQLDNISWSIKGPQKTRGTCWLRSSALRAAPWCKLAVVAFGLAHGYRTIVYIDSDAFLRSGKGSLSIGEFFHNYRKNASTLVDTASGGRRTPVWMPSNEPFEGPYNRVNTGLQIWRGGELLNESWRVLRLWWATDIRPRQHPYEQSAVDGLQEGQDYGLLHGLPWIDESHALPAVHVHSHHTDRRVPILRDELARERGELLARCGPAPIATRINVTATVLDYLE